VGGKLSKYHSNSKKESPNGGIWITKIKKEDNIDKMWESLLLALIGNLIY